MEIHQLNMKINALNSQIILFLHHLMLNNSRNKLTVVVFAESSHTICVYHYHNNDQTNWLSTALIKFLPLQSASQEVPKSMLSAFSRFC